MESVAEVEAGAEVEVEEGQAWEPNFTDDPAVVRESNPHERALCYAFLMWPEESIAGWRNRVSGIDKPGQRLIKDPRHRALIEKIIELYRQGVRTMNMHTLKRHCSPDDIERFGGWRHIVKHFDFLMTGGGFHEQIDALLDRYRSEEFVSLASLAAESAAEGMELNEIIAMVTEKSRGLLKTSTGMITPTIEICLDEIDKKVTVEDNGQRIPTTFRHLAGLVGDYKRKQIRLVGAPPGNGKTAFAMQEIETALNYGFTVAAFLMESDFSQFTDRYIARNYAINTARFNPSANGKGFTHAELRAIQDGMERLQKFENRLFLSDVDNFTPAMIDSACQEIVNQTGRPIDLIVIDYISTMEIPRDKGESQYDASKRAMLDLNRICARNNAAMLALDQLNVDAVRNSMGKTDKMPTIGAFRGATSTEKAKVVIVLNKDPQAMLNGGNVIEQQMVVCKTNDGISGFVRSLFLKPFTMHIEDTSGYQRNEHARWLNALNFDMKFERKDTQNRAPF